MCASFGLFSLDFQQKTNPAPAPTPPPHAHFVLVFLFAENTKIHTKAQKHSNIFAFLHFLLRKTNVRSPPSTLHSAFCACECVEAENAKGTNTEHMCMCFCVHMCVCVSRVRAAPPRLRSYVEH